MFRLRLHPSPSGLLTGIAVIAFWALLWVWFIAQLVQEPRSRAAAARAGPPELTAPGLPSHPAARGGYRQSPSIAGATG